LVVVVVEEEVLLAIIADRLLFLVVQVVLPVESMAVMVLRHRRFLPEVAVVEAAAVLLVQP
jgi:hypothetical protein